MSTARLELPDSLVSTDWLAGHLDDERLVVLDASVVGAETAAGFRWLSGLDAYLIDGHIPGAVFADLLEEFSDSDGPYAFTRPDLFRLAEAARSTGIDDTRTVVVFDSGLGQWASRLWWLLAAGGLDRVAILDGGLAKWKAEGRPLETGFVAPRPAASVTLAERPSWWADRAEVRRVVDGEASASLVCSASRTDFTGETGRRDRRGHIPGSVHVPLTAVVDRETNAFLPDAPDVPAGPDERVIAYCGGGIAAAATAFALRRAGRRDVAVYDGSLDEWSSLPDAPLVSLSA
ncbi:sulfurtransferase [Agromyces protaetiae]|uniref:Sulfurtransferase n=1 Tax=Agromyces protaetiae TaxID=2509455 RepID=A0A4P6FHI5_9MICO|nr:rhodanese-like domain-containing protein [Agromyces protaetiae]QAY73377.1 sulfurtransferase [Agromyces protaetiae]